MLNRIAIEAALPLAQRLDERGLRILPSEGTPLMSLYMAADGGVAGEVGELADVIELTHERSRHELHRIAKEEIVAIGTESVRRLHKLAHEVALPHIKQLYPQVQEAVARRRVEAVLPYNVVMREIPLVLSNPAYKTLLDKYPVAVTQNASFATRILRIADLDEIKQLTKTGMSGLDAELHAVLSKSNDAGYAALQNVMGGKTHPSEINEDYLPGLLVLAAGIYNEPGGGINLSLVDYNTIVSQLTTFTAKLARASMLRYEQLKRGGVLYSATRSDITSIVVMGEVYRSMLDKGLTPEALIGNEMNGRRFNQTQLIENKAVLEKIYHREMSLRQLKVQSEMIGITAEELRRVMIADLRTNEVEDVDVRIKELNEIIKYLTTAVKMDDIAQLTTICVCKMYYDNTDVLTFIKLMNEIGRDMAEDTDPREIALLASFKYISRWLVGQMGLLQA